MRIIPGAVGIPLIEDGLVLFKALCLGVIDVIVMTFWYIFGMDLTFFKLF